MSIPLYQQSKLWKMSPSEFNEWRRRNDLPKLLKLFKEKLPGFIDWLEEFNIERFFYNPSHTGRWFTGSRSKKYVEFTHAKYTGYEIIDTEEGKSNFTVLNKNSVKITQQFEFIPYFIWGQKRFKKKYFICIDQLNKGFSDSIKYSNYSSVYDPNTGRDYASRAMIFKEFSVLKLGECQVKGTMALDRNLDFVDLDGITFSGKGFVNNSLEISLSSCREIVFKEVSFSHLCFYNSKINQIDIDSSRIRKVVYFHSEIGNIVLNKSYLDFFLIIHSKVSDISVKETNIVDHKYQELLSRNNSREYTDIKNVHRKLRIAFQAQGKIAEAREHYYKEKKFERKELFSPYLRHHTIFPKRQYGGSLRQLFRYYKSGTYTLKKTLLNLLDLFVFHTKIWLFPKYFWKTFKFKMRWFSSLFQDILWGYGEKPFHAFISSVLFIIIFASTYYWFGDGELNKKLPQSIQYSIKAFLGGAFFEDETTVLLKWLISIENIIGVFLLGIFVAGYANKSRY
jgi:hypothetical protein